MIFPFDLFHSASLGIKSRAPTFPAAVQHALGSNRSSTAALFCVTLCNCGIVSSKTASLESLTSQPHQQNRAVSHHPFTTLFRSRMQANVEAATSSLSAPIRMADSALSNHPQPPPKPRTLQCISQLFQHGTSRRFLKQHDGTASRGFRRLHRLVEGRPPGCLS